MYDKKFCRFAGATTAVVSPGCVREYSRRSYIRNTNGIVLRCAKCQCTLRIGVMLERIAHAVGAMLAISAMAGEACQRVAAVLGSESDSQSTTKNMPKQVIKNIQTLPAVPPFGRLNTPLLSEDTSGSWSSNIGSRRPILT